MAKPTPSQKYPGEVEYDDWIGNAYWSRSKVRLYHRPIERAEAEANARLMAAAPRLLAALEELIVVPNKRRPDSVWQEAISAVNEAKYGPVKL